MVKHILRIRKVDRFVFDSVKEGDKIIETRAATVKNRKIKKGDFLVFVCEGEKLEKEIKKVSYFKSIDGMVKEIDFKKIMPFVNSIEEMKQVCYSFSNYQEKIKQFGLVAFELK